MVEDKSLVRQQGAKNASGSQFNKYREEIKKHLKLKVPVKSILKIINKQMEYKLSYSSLMYYIEHDLELILIK
ncbi:MAG: hypothetical protein EPN82_12890 [Bacteroidetes bacterium]|nr:MAG: hypothetical protein EPN82_12890 [Bacteroidota bacterium]